MSESNGSFSATKSKTHKCGWRVRRVFYVNGERKHKSVPFTALSALGFSDSMTLEQAKARAAQLNAEGAVKRKEQASLVGIATRVERDRLHHSAFIPDDLNNQFLKWLEVNTSGTADYVQKQKSVWGAAKKAIIATQLLPENFASHKKQIFRHFASKNQAPAYVKKIIGLMNLYGKFCARLMGKYYEPIDEPRGSESSMLADAYQKSKRYVGPSDPLTPEVLALLKDKLPVEQYNWLYISLWFGLRPIEVDLVIRDRARRDWSIEVGEGCDVLRVYQSKLTSLKHDERFKLIPVKYKEQRTALAMIIAGNASPPLCKTIRAYSGLENLKLYGGRKHFTDLMREKGENIDDVSAWMGHTTTGMTLSKYKDKKRVSYGLKLVKG